MRTTKLIPALLFFMLCFTKKHLIAQTEGESFTIYLIRHSEKEIFSENQLDPALTTCGIERSWKSWGCNSHILFIKNLINFRVKKIIIGKPCNMNFSNF